MTNDECQMSKEIRSSNVEGRPELKSAVSVFGSRHSFGFRHSSFGFGNCGSWKAAQCSRDCRLEWPRRLRALRQCVEPVQRGIAASSMHQCLMGPALNDAATVEVKDQ